MSLTGSTAKKRGLCMDMRLTSMLDAAQAQKHVTVNEALARLDTAAQLRLVSISVTVPPVTAGDGVAYYVPTGAVNAWDGHIGEVAIFANGGWVFMLPRTGWRAWVEDIERHAFFDGFDWRIEAVSVSAGGAATLHRVSEFDHVIAAGASSTTLTSILNGQQVIGITGRVLSAISGTGLTGWDLGVASSTNRYGSGLGLAKNSWIRGLSSTPVTYWSDTPLVLTSVGGDFSGGTVRLVIHSVQLEYPRAV
jgi:uncharacterized protein DUF2793